MTHCWLILRCRHSSHTAASVVSLLQERLHETARPSSLLEFLHSCRSRRFSVSGHHCDDSRSITITLFTWTHAVSWKSWSINPRCPYPGSHPGTNGVTYCLPHTD